MPVSPDGSDDQPAAGEHPTPRRRSGRTNGQRAVIAGAAFASVLSLASAAALATGQYFVEQRQVVDIHDPSENRVAGDTTAARDGTGPGSHSTTDTHSDAGTGRSDPTTDVTSLPTFPDIDPDAKNFLITGADNNACADPESSESGGLGARRGERSDTIVIWRVDPATSRAAVLSLPRDLWVTIPDAGQSRINSTYRRDDPQLLIDTIYTNFGIAIDHFIQVDFCAFKTLVDAVGGVEVPFDYPTRDTESGLDVPTKGCFAFDGDAALGYVRSRHYEYLPDGADPVSGWEQDPSSDLGRISRQQDFMRRMLARVLDKGTFNPSVARSLIRATTDYVVTDDELSPQRLLAFAGVLRQVEPDSIPNYQITASPAVIGGSAVLLPELETERMQRVLSLFRGELSLAKLPSAKDAPTSTTAQGHTTAPAPTTGTGPSDDDIDDSAPDDIEFGIVPPAGVRCD